MYKDNWWIQFADGELTNDNPIALKTPQRSECNRVKNRTEISESTQITSEHRAVNDKM